MTSTTVATNREFAPQMQCTLQLVPHRHSFQPFSATSYRSYMLTSWHVYVSRAVISTGGRTMRSIAGALPCFDPREPQLRRSFGFAHIGC